MPTVGVAVMAHPARIGHVEELRQRLNPDVVVWDSTSNVWDTGRRAWLEGLNFPVTHWAVIQDDALVPEDLARGVEQALGYVDPPSPLSLYLGRARPFAEYVENLVSQARNRDASFITTNKVNWGVGLVVPQIQIERMIDYCDRRGDKMYDRRLGKYFLHREIRVWHTWPSLVDHRTGIPSVLGHRREDRRAHDFIGEEKSALGLDWSKGVVHVDRSKSKRKP